MSLGQELLVAFCGLLIVSALIETAARKIWKAMREHFRSMRRERK